MSILALSRIVRDRRIGGIISGSMAITASTTSAPPTASATWFLRVVVWFPTAYTIVIIAHESAHALAAAALGFSSTLFNFWVDHHFAGATVVLRAIVGAAGPLASLVLGVVAALAYRVVRRTAAGVPLLLLAANGVSNFFGNLMSAAFVGDFSNAAQALAVPVPFRYGVAVLGAIGVGATLFIAGRELRRWTSPGTSRLMAATGTIIVPVVVGTLFVIVINEPTPMGASFASARWSEGAFWIVAAIGAFFATAGTTSELHPAKVLFVDVLALVVTAGVVRLMSTGVAIAAFG
jgi:hypothetical protein